MNKRYKNMDDVTIKNSMQYLLRWMKERTLKKKDLSLKIEYCQQPEIDKLQKNDRHFSITWIGHSSFLIQINGVNILTDPVFSTWMGVRKRLTKPGITPEELPEIHVVLISHAHYDHLDFRSLKKIKGNPVYYIPSGAKRYFNLKKYKQIYEANWWESFTYNDIAFHFVPAQHWSKRSLRDTNKAHWGGWVLEDERNNRITYFAGDTAYFSGFEEIAKKYKMDVVLMPIGAYEPEWFMKSSHINPEDAIKAFIELNGGLFIPMHYGAFRLADDTGPEALQRLHNEWERLKLPDERLATLGIGETKWFKKNN